jgi:N-acetylglucosamine-6-sulfatase
MLDDFDTRAVAQMPACQDLVAEQGATFANFFVTTPICCPSRASLLRGQYAHNHGVLNSTGNTTGFAAFRRLDREGSTLATWLHDAGYRTALLGKYMNGYPGRRVPATYVPPGWDEWGGFRLGMGLESATYFDYDLNENGTLVAYGTRPEDYLTDVLAAKASAFIAQSAEAEQPFFLYVAPFAPHAPSTPAPRHESAFPNAVAPRVPSFDEADVSDKPAWVRDQAALTPDEVVAIDAHHGLRLRSLLAVDDLVASVIDALHTSGTLERTYIIFTSDNGFHQGEHRIAFGKRTPYEEAIRVPLLVRGPGVPAGLVVEELALNVDLAPTFAELAGVDVPEFVDGRSLVPLLNGAHTDRWRQVGLAEVFEVNVESGSDQSLVPPFRALRTAEYAYVEYATGERELYDLRGDPYQLDNLVTVADSALLERMSNRLAQLATCVGATCQAVEDASLDGLGLP